MLVLLAMAILRIMYIMLNRMCIYIDEVLKQACIEL